MQYLKRVPWGVVIPALIVLAMLVIAILGVRLGFQDNCPSDPAYCRHANVEDVKALQGEIYRLQTQVAKDGR